MQITTATQVIGLIGHPVGHSLSPVLHNHLYRALGLDLVYHAFDVHPTQVEAAVKGFLALGFLGFNITIPHKEAVFPLLHEIKEEAQAIGAVNTVKVENGRLVGYNTDGQGFLQSLVHAGHSLTGKKVAILGAGGAARALGISIAGENPESIAIINRTQHKAASLAHRINQYKSPGAAYVSQRVPKEIDVIINTTQLGMWPDTEGNPLGGYELSSQTLVCDIVYNPEQTTMLQYAASQGCKTFGGLNMLIGQGLRAVEIWLDITLPDNAGQLMMEAIGKMK